MAFPLSENEHAIIKNRIEGAEELIIAAAIRVRGVVVMVERPGRHGDCINFLYGLGVEHRDQGFVTNHGRFVDRVEAAQIALDAGQGSPRDQCGGQLFSEDMWNDWDVTSRTPIRSEDVFGGGGT